MGAMKVMQDGNKRRSHGSAESAQWVPFGSDPVRVFDLRHDELPVSSRQDEFDIDDYVATQDDATRAQVAAAGSWVADTLYPGEPTLASLRLRAGLSQAEFAAKCGLKQPHVSRCETGKHEPDIFQAQALADALGVSLDALVKVLKQSTPGAQKCRRPNRREF